MSIVRGEIPKPLDLEEILEKIVNPAHHFTSSADFGNRTVRASKSASVVRSLTTSIKDEWIGGADSEKDFLSKKSLQLNSPPSSTHRCLFRAVTNDGTNSIYYPNGQLAIITATVCGFYVDNVPVSSTPGIGK